MSAGKDSVNAELINIVITTSIDVPHNLFSMIWKSEIVPEGWSKRLIVKLIKKEISLYVLTGEKLPLYLSPHK